MQLLWDEVGERLFETGVDHGVLYLPDGNGAYVNGVAWNGLTTVTEKPTGAAPNAKYADNIKYLNLRSAEQFEATVQAYTYPDEFAQFDGAVEPTPGVFIGQQNRRAFGLSYRTLLGNDIEGDDFAYKLHLVYGCTCSPSQRAHATINDTPDAMAFSWDLATSPVAVPGFKPTSILTIVSNKVVAATLADLERILYGDAGVNPALPLPSTIITMFEGGVVEVAPVQPAFDQPTNTITIPATAGVTYYIGGVAQVAGPVVIAADTVVEARPNVGYIFTPGVDNDWFYNFV